jgi:hypothetical protein
LDAKREEEIIAELAGHLEDLYKDLVRQGKPPSEAAQLALSAAADWDEVRREIQLAANEEAIMNYRVKTLWLPGACTSALSMLVLRLFQIPPAPAPHVFWPRHDIPLVIYWQWLLCLPLIGAIGAYWSQRAGGKLLERALAASFPALTWMGFPGLLLPFVLVFHWIVYHDSLLVPSALFLLGWVVLPGASLLLGALPFFRGHAAESRPTAALH